MRLLLVEDDQPIADGLIAAFKADGFTLQHVDNGREAIASIEFEPIDIVILDLGLPDIDGFEVLKKSKKLKPQVPVLILTARDQVSDRVRGLDGGADDYLVKPFDYDELSARIRVLERRLSNRTSDALIFEDLRLDPKGFSLEVAGQTVTIAKKEFKILKALLEANGRVLTKETLEAKIYDYAEEVASNALEVHIHHLRKKLPKGIIKTVRGIGYTLEKNSDK